ncbi:uncharacterized protein LOC143282122 [Babylonia areolata]|uniref:uncharacterized protein LOC143282122 n=1 Tax=Babylonia areolata TaxID=304850 RepID=UPI003FCF4524
MMEPNMTGDDDSEEEDWMDTDWHTIQDSSSSKTSSEKKKETDMKSQEDNQSLKESGASLMTRMQLNDHKAGMKGLDKEHINRIIYEVSKGSRFFENERRKEEQVQQRIQEQEKRKLAISNLELQKGIIEADKLVAELNTSRDLTQTIVHVDMDAFYAAVEMRDNPSLRSKPMAVGGIGMLSTSNYEARKYGVRAAMPGFIGKKLCPQLVIVPVNFTKYREVSQHVRQIFADYDPHFCPMSLDEAYLNFTEHVAKRQTLPPAHRSFLKRCQTPADPAFCCCDLNTTIRDSAFKDYSAETRQGTTHRSSVDHSQKQVDVNGNCDNKNPEAGVCEDSADEPKSADELKSADEPKSTDELGRQVCEAQPQASRQGAAQFQCPSCRKAVPAYEMVTFGLDVESAVHEMRCRIEQRTCLTASAGIAPNMMLSKVCSDQNKPNGQFYLPPTCEDVRQFVHNLPIRKISGIGRVSEQLLGALGISTCHDLFEKRALLYHLYSPVSFSYFMRVACGIGSTQVDRASEEERKSMSTEQTFGELSQPEELYDKCLELCQSLAEDLAKEQLKGKTVSLKLKTTDFQVRTRAQTISSYTSDADTIFSVARGILRNEMQAESPRLLRLRLMGVRISKLVSESECPQEKQNTILGFFKKTAVSDSCDKNPADPPKQGSSLSARNNHNDSVDCPSLETSSMGVPEGNLPSALADCELEEEVHTSDFYEASVHHNFSADEEDILIVRTNLWEEDRQSGNSFPAEHKTGPCISDKDVHENSSDMIEGTTRAQNIQKQQEGDFSSETSQAQNSNLNSCAGQKSKVETSAPAVVPADAPCLSHHRAEAAQIASPSSYGYDWDDEIRSSNTDRARQNALDHSMARDPFTCPVCCKPVGCINLTDFNAHIDKCLQPQSQQPASSQDSVTRTSSTNKASSVQTTSSQKSKSGRSNANKRSSDVNSLAGDQKQRQASGMVSTSAAGDTSAAADSGVPQPRLPSIQGEGVPGWGEAGSMETPGLAPALYGDQREPGVCSGEGEYSEAGSLEYMVCPVCGAERADWTLDTFNGHVDACLNRDTISRILREQQGSEEPPRKRPASSRQGENGTCQQGKKAKKSQSSKTERSILSFFKR